MKDRRTILAGAVGLFRATLLGQKSLVATGPEPFGYKTGWIALKGKLGAPATGGEFSISLRDQAPCGYIAIWRGSREYFFSAENPHPVAGGPSFIPMEQDSWLAADLAAALV